MHTHYTKVHARMRMRTHVRTHTNAHAYKCTHPHPHMLTHARSRMLTNRTIKIRRWNNFFPDFNMDLINFIQCMVPPYFLPQPVRKLLNRNFILPYMVMWLHLHFHHWKMTNNDYFSNTNVVRHFPVSSGKPNKDILNDTLKTNCQQKL